MQEVRPSRRHKLALFDGFTRTYRVLHIEYDVAARKVMHMLWEHKSNKLANVHGLVTRIFGNIVADAASIHTSGLLQDLHITHIPTGL